MSDPMAALKARFLRRARADLEVLRRPEGDPRAIATVVHQLSGAAGVFGFPEVSRLAARVDDQIHAGEPPDAADLNALVAGIEALSDAGADRST